MPRFSYAPNDPSQLGLDWFHILDAEYPGTVKILIRGVTTAAAIVGLLNNADAAEKAAIQ